MLLRPIDRKLLRELARLKGQIVTIAIVLAGGLASFVSMRGTFESIEASRDAYYDRARFAHVFASSERAPESVARELEKLPGVAVVETRVEEEVTLPIQGMERAAYGHVLSLPPSGEPGTNAIHLVDGRYPKGADEAVVLQSFADAHGLHPGDSVPAVIHGKLRKLRIAGVAMSPEYVYAIRPGAMADDPRRYAVLWMARTTLAAAYQLEGSFNEVSLRLQPGASEADTIQALDRILAPYGPHGAIARKDQLSNRILTGELAQLESLAGMVPIVFLGVAAFLINMVLGRLIALQRGEIAVLKAIGYTNREVARHYLGLVGVVMIPGGLLGLGLGYWLGRVVLRLYESFFRFPELRFAMSGRLVATGLLISTASAVVGALLAVRAAAKLPPAEAMRPPAPARYHRGVLERLGLGHVVGPSGMMIVRELQRRALRTALSSVGIAGAIALIILGHFGMDSLDNYLETVLRREQRQDLAVTFAHAVAPRAIGELARSPGVITAEGLRAIPIRARYEHRKRDSVLMGLPSDGSLRRLVARGGREVVVPADGILVTSELGKILGLRVGDRPTLELLEGDRRTVRPVVVGFVDEAAGLQIYAQSGFVSSLKSDRGAVSAVMLKVDPRELASVEERLRRYPDVIDVSDLDADVQRLRDMNASMIDVWTAISISLAASVIFGVVYNNARIALAVRSRELASLRVLGFSRREISAVLIGGLAIEVLIAIPVGLTLGRVWGGLFMSTVDQESFRFQVVVAGKTYLIATIVTLLAAAASALWVRRSLDRLDLVGVLKTRE